uniref:PD-(D/E)XK nuclease superfamily protein n=1 Tax=Candidatus Kentrum sp. FM TaxID=2126340 RepID=A0A450TUZ1_9GAMM|nr:MAG: PD-(D/E)XK nuclease superfamily protein [Candidatus Kentron sp. FM]VFJ73032.1 MAG: PD-(D/E)XK nuclease superfamily protein [Candidatus Kentron sp. FM]VFK20864.1 MAG: PD-(D/E)XK nuclease superfamily protein [Candidatus Kentron sp. FM]
MQTPKKLPIGIQGFEKLRQGGYVYVDKTEQVYRLITEGVAWFLSRPRRFGKSLLVSTLAAIFQGRRDLFEGLWIAGSDYDWPAHPVIHLDMSTVMATSRTPDEFESGLIGRLDKAAIDHGLEPVAFARAAAAFDDLIDRLAEKKGKVVVLVDEYDSPILEYLTDTPKALEMRGRLQNFYTILKARDEELRFVFLTGVTRFSKVSVFSKINHLDDITYDRDYGSMLGITQTELESVFADRIRDLARQENIPIPALLDRIRDWYNGYRFHPASGSVYNPVSCLNYLKKREFSPWWFETGTPTFLVDLLQKSSFPIADLERKQVSEHVFSHFELDRLEPVPLLQQTGYLTITDYDAEQRLYTLDYPNREVREAFLIHLAGTFSGRGRGNVTDDLRRLEGALAANEPDGFFEILTAILAGIPYDIQVNRERYYQSLFYLVFRLMGLHIHTEVRTAIGRIDATIELDSGVWIFEFKLDDSAEAALAQIKEKDYAGPYRAAGRPVYLVGVNFDWEKRNIGGWEMETLGGRRT